MNVQQVCSYCGQAFKDVFLHIVAACQKTLDLRNTFLEYIVDYCIPQFSVYVTDLENEDILCLLLGKWSPRTKSLEKDLSLRQTTLLHVVNSFIKIVNLFYTLV